MYEDPEQLIRERDAWMEDCKRHLRNEQYYRGLVLQIGECLGQEVYVCDDGSISQDILCAKVPELVERQLAELRQAIGLLTTLHPTMQMDVDRPLAMAEKIHAFVTSARAPQESPRG